MVRSMYDVVYFLKDDIDAYELKYSLRSVEKNFPYERVWFVGGQPDGLRPDRSMAIDQPGLTKWQRVRGMLDRVCCNNEITEDFWLFNDDFFILQPWQGTDALFNGTLSDHIKHIEARHNGQTGYTAQLRECERELIQAGFGTNNYAIHCPMLINRAKMLATLHRFPMCPMFRSLYGNMWNVGGVSHKDCKIVGLDRTPDSEWCSTSNESFKRGAVGRCVRDMFKQGSRFEL